MSAYTNAVPAGGSCRVTVTPDDTFSARELLTKREHARQPVPFPGRHLRTVDVKEPFERERLGLGFGLAVWCVDEPGGGLFPLHQRAHLNPLHA